MCLDTSKLPQIQSVTRRSHTVSLGAPITPREPLLGFAGTPPRTHVIETLHIPASLLGSTMIANCFRRGSLTSQRRPKSACARGRLLHWRASVLLYYLKRGHKARGRRGFRVSLVLTSPSPLLIVGLKSLDLKRLSPSTNTSYKSAPLLVPHAQHAPFPSTKDAAQRTPQRARRVGRRTRPRPL